MLSITVAQDVLCYISPAQVFLVAFYSLKVKNRSQYFNIRKGENIFGDVIW